MPFDWHKTRWPAKLLLFGEYTVLDGCMGLGIQIPKFSLQVDGSKHVTSTIPIGHGLGSSAALCLAMFELTEKESFPNGLTFEERFGLLRKMESVYHTSSSGVDLLICAATGPVLIDMDNRHVPKVHSAEIRPPVELALIDVGSRQESNSRFIPRVLHRFKNDPQDSQKWERYKTLTASGIEAFLSGNTDVLGQALTQIREIQCKVGMLAPELGQKLENSSGVWGWKAIGAGGGGSVLVFGQKDFELSPDVRKESVLWRGSVGGV